MGGRLEQQQCTRSFNWHFPELNELPVKGVCLETESFRDTQMESSRRLDWLWPMPGKNETGIYIGLRFYF